MNNNNNNNNNYNNIILIIYYLLKWLNSIYIKKRIDLLKNILCRME